MAGWQLESFYRWFWHLWEVQGHRIKGTMETVPCSLLSILDIKIVEKPSNIGKPSQKLKSKSSQTSHKLLMSVIDGFCWCLNLPKSNNLHSATTKASMWLYWKLLSPMGLGKSWFIPNKRRDRSFQCFMVEGEGWSLEPASIPDLIFLEVTNNLWVWVNLTVPKKGQQNCQAVSCKMLDVLAGPE